MEVNGKQGAVNPFLQSHSAIIRIWHWITFILITLILLTVIINGTLLNPRTNAEIVQNRLSGQNITITERQAFSVAHFFDDQLWNLHKYLGIILSAFLLLRIIAEFLVPKDERVKQRLASALHIFKSNSGDSGLYKHYLVVSYTYSVFYIVLIYLVLSGLLMSYGRQMGIEGNIIRPVREIHAACQWIMYAFVLYHVGGVIIADLGKAKGAVSGMINGNK